MMTHGADHDPFYCAAIEPPMTRFEAFKKWWTEVPDCRACGGTGKPRGDLYDVMVYWKGQLVRTCHRCRGRGKQSV